jgi:putative nucleotidyltransferase with HDIG domain
MSTAQGVLEKVHSLPTLSATVARLSVLLRDDRSGAAEFELAIRPDPALTANLLKLANSAYFGLSRQVASVRQAIQVIGLVKVYGVAASAAIARLVPARLTGYEIDASGFWKHSVAVAVLSEQLARELRLPVPDLTFTAGLLHDVGKLAVSTFLAADADDVMDAMEDESLSFVDAERRVLGTDHAEIGALVAERWNLPVAVGNAARWHHHPGLAGGGHDQTTADLAHLADGLAHSLGMGADAGGMARAIDQGATARLNVTHKHIERVAGASLAGIRELTGLLAPNSGGNQ